MAVYSEEEDPNVEMWQRQEAEQEKYEYDIKTLVKDNTVYFDSYRQGYFYYNLTDKKSAADGISIIHQFPVPLSDIGTATLLATDKAITFMRWIRKAIADKTLIKI